MLMLCMVVSGCCGRRPHDCRGIQTLPSIDPLSVLSAESGGVSASFDALENDADDSLLSFFSAEPLGLSLNEAFCLASRNSSLGNLIDRERKALCCESGCIDCIDRFLAGQAREQRNKSAADAGELLVRLAGIQLQSQIIEQSMQKISDLQQTVDAADENGLATADAQSELDNQSIEVMKSQSRLRTGMFEINTKLNLLLGLDSCCPRLILPSHHFDMEHGADDPRQLIIDALTNRPELNSLSGFGACSGDERCLAILSNLDQRLGISATPPVRRLLLCARKGHSQTDCCCHIRQQQLDELRSLREELIRQQVLQHVKDLHLHYENLKLENLNLQRLESEAKSIDSSAELNASEAFIDSISNFAGQQLAKSRRIDSMVEFEVARIRLDKATGAMTVACQGSFETDCSSCNE